MQERFDIGIANNESQDSRLFFNNS